MIIKKYKIEPELYPDSSNVKQWTINIEFEPSWIDRWIFGKFFVDHKTLTGSYTNWSWDDGTTANYLWRIWAYNLTKKYKSRNKTYVNRRFD